MAISTKLSDNIDYLREIFPLDKSYDLITRDLNLLDSKAFWIGLNGLCDSSILQLLIANLQDPSFTDDATINNLQDYVSSKIGFIQTEVSSDWNKIIKQILSGPSVLFVDGFGAAIILDARKYPIRSIEEPDIEKASRGARDGFVETLVYNTALIRRRIRNPKLSFEIKAIGTETKTDVVVAYIDGSVDQTLLDEIKHKLDSVMIPALTMGPKSLEELIVKKRWYNPLPQIRYTERPDVACSYLLEGYIAVIVDNFPCMMIFPCNIFQFTQNPEDYYQNPSVGNYLRIMRFGCILLSLFLLPVFLLLATYSLNLPYGFKVITTGDVSPTKLFIYVILVEVSLDIFKYSSMNAASGLSNSLGLIGGIIIGDMAIKLEWATPEVVFFGAATMLTTLALSSQEFGQALRLYRFFLVILTGITGIFGFGIWGFLIGLFLTLLSIVTTPSIANKSYLWPLIPFDWKALKTLLIRYPNAKYQAKHKKQM